MQKTFQAPLKYSQNFIQSSALITKLIRLTDINKTDTILEIGAGKGVITGELAKAAARVISVEKDKELFKLLNEKFGTSQNVHVICADFLHYDFGRIGKYKVFANIPFSISAEILKKLLFAKNPPTTAYLFLSEEVANKFMARNSKETLTSLITKPFYKIKVIYRFNRLDFFPVPSVKVLLVKFELIENPLISQNEMRDYINFLTFAFNQWKPNIKLALNKVFSHLQMKIISRNVGFNQLAKPSEVSLDQWIQIFQEFKKIVPVNKQGLIYGAENKLVNTQRKMRRRNLEVLKNRK